MTTTPPMARRVAASALLGSAVEYYDFTLYATAAALFLGKVFFAPLGPAAGTVASFATFGLAFVARPAGAVAFGYWGDRIGRRPALVGSVTLMGLATFGIGLLPGYATNRCPRWPARRAVRQPGFDHPRPEAMAGPQAVARPVA